MTGHKPFSGLTDGFSADRQRRVAAKTEALLEEMSVAELRKALDQTQHDLARSLNISQPAVARMEQRGDMHVSNLRRVIEALGGELEIRARFPQGTVTITNFAGDKQAEKLRPDEPSATDR